MTLVAAILRAEAPHPDVDPLTGAVRFGPAALVGPDAAALEQALRIAAAWGARLLAIGVGEGGDALREAAALGAEVVQAGGDAGALLVDERPLARALAAPLAGADLVLCGDWG